MNRVLLVAAMLLAGSGAFGGTLMNRSWSDLKASGNLKTGEIVNRGSREMLKVSNATGGELRVTVLAIHNPGVTEPSYSVTGEVEYQGVEGRGYLEILSYFPPPRPVLHSGPIGWLTGGGRRAFEMLLPLHKGDPKPTKLELNVVLPGGGTVYLGPVKLLNHASARDASGTTVRGQLWSPCVGGTIKAVVGVVVSALFVLIVIMYECGKGRAVAITALKALVCLGIISGIAGAIAALIHQPAHIYQALFYCAAMLFVCPAIALPAVTRRYDELELRRIAARDAGG